MSDFLGLNRFSIINSSRLIFNNIQALKHNMGADCTRSYQAELTTPNYPQQLKSNKKPLISSSMYFCHYLDISRHLQWHPTKLWKLQSIVSSITQLISLYPTKQLMMLHLFLNLVSKSIKKLKNNKKTNMILVFNSVGWIIIPRNWN